LDQPNGNASDPFASSTQTTDLSCLDSDYNSTVKGRKFKSCVSCEAFSDRIDVPSEEDDLYWFLFNIKFTVDWCVFGYPDNPNTTAAETACSNACGPIQPPLTDRLLKTNMSLTYQYCQNDYSSGTFLGGVDACIACLSKMDGTVILGNFLSALKAGCQQQVPAGKTLSLAGDLFAVTPPLSTTSSASGQSTATSSTTSANQTAHTSSSSSAGSHSGLSKGAATGIGIGIGAVAIGGFIALALCCVRRRQGAESLAKRNKSWPLAYGSAVQNRDSKIHEVSEGNPVGTLPELHQSSNLSQPVYEM
jgi:hypothetical protein